MGAAARGAWNVGDFARARRLAARAAEQVPQRGRRGPDTRAMSPPTSRCTRATSTRHFATTRPRSRWHADDPIRLVWTLYYVAICHAVSRAPQLGLTAAQECLRVADSTANPTAASMARYALGLVLKKADPAQAFVLFDEAAQLAASVRNFWWQGIALMEAAATRAVHGDPAAAAAALGDVLDHRDRVGDWTQQWLNLRYIVRLLVQVGADSDALTLHHCLLAAAKPSPLDESHPGPLSTARAGNGSPRPSRTVPDCPPPRRSP
ncbi:MAG: hypothetical protein ACXV5Q_14140 [Frankiaceae bacterium]